MLKHEFATAVKPPRVVILGANGFVARRLAAWLVERQISCRPIGSTEVDLVRPSATAALRHMIEPDDAIVFTSCLTPEKGRDRATFLKNIAMADHLCGLIAEECCAHVVYISSDSVYGPRHTEIDEECCCESSDMYALSHIVREKLLLEASGSAGVPLAILRPAAVYGATDTHNSYGPNRFMRSALQEGKITLFGQGEEIRDHVYIDDLVQIIGLCLLHRSAGILNTASGTALAFLEVARLISAQVRRSVVLEMVPRRVPIYHRRFRLSALRSAFPGFQPMSLESGIRRALEELTRQDNTAAGAP
jgi:UDP-glucose 4-epimerase